MGMSKNLHSNMEHMDTCLNMFEHPCSIYFRMMIFHDYMMIPQDVDQSPGTLDIE